MSANEFARGVRNVRHAFGLYIVGGCVLSRNFCVYMGSGKQTPNRVDSGRDYVIRVDSFTNIHHWP